MGGLEIAGVVGTWVAAGVAIIALVGIAGPILIWRASRTERHRALAAIGDDNNGYMSKGIRLGPNTYLGQRIRAPILKTIPRLTDKNLKWSSASLKETRSPSTWVQFGALLNAYGVEFSRGDSLVIKHGKALLPVHPLWVLGIGKDPSASRAMSTTLCKLDNVLAQLGSQEKVVDHIIGMLTVTNVEFQELVYQSMRHLRESTTATVELDMRAGVIKVPSAFGVMQQFIVDLDRIFPEDMRSHETISVRHTTVVLAAMKSCLRSEMLKSCHDITPLLKLVQGVQERGDMVYLS